MQSARDGGNNHHHHTYPPTLYDTPRPKETMMHNHPILVAFLCIITASGTLGFAVRSISVYSVHTPTTLAAKGGGKKKKSKRSAQTTKGFGAPPPKLEDVLSEFKTRVPDDADDQSCPCGSGKVYGECCGPLHRGDQKCLTMTDVLRSRYTAFSWRNIDYVMSTTHESCRDFRDDRVAWAKDLNKNGMFDSFEFVQLTPGEEEMSDDNENEGFVEFKVKLRAKEDSDYVAGQETVITERSRFIRDPDVMSWKYASGDVRSDVAGLEDTTLNV